MSKKINNDDDGSQWGYIHSFTAEGFKQTPEPHDTPESLIEGGKVGSRIYTQLKADLAASKPKHKLLGKQEKLSAVIEVAMGLALDHESYHSVWEAMIEIALRTPPPPPLLGVTGETDSELMIQYRSGGKTSTGNYSKDNLKNHFIRQNKLRQSSPKLG